MNGVGQWPGRSQIDVHDRRGPTIEPMQERRGVRGVKSASRTVALLELLAERGEQPSRLDELAEDLGVPRSSMYQLLQTLVDSGWVRTDATGSLYGIGIRALLTGTGYLDGDRHIRAVRPYLDEASDALGETIHMARLDGRDVVYLATRESHEYLRTISRVGRRVPAHRRRAGQGSARRARRRRAASRRRAVDRPHGEHAHRPRRPARRPGPGARARLLHRPRGDGAGHHAASASPCATEHRPSMPSAARSRWPG